MDAFSVLQHTAKAKTSKSSSRLIRSSNSNLKKVTMVFTRALLLVSASAIGAWADEECLMCYDTGYEQGQSDCEPDTTGAVTSDPHVNGLRDQR